MPGERHYPRRSILGYASLLVASLLLAQPAQADIYYLRKTNAECPVPAAPNCQTSLYDVLTAIHALDPPPSRTRPVLVDIGAGEFRLDTPTPTDPLPPGYCDNVSHVAFRGTGPATTVLTGGGFDADDTPFSGKYAVLARECGDLEMSDLAIHVDPAVSKSGIAWLGLGESRWNNFELSGALTYGWWDTPTTVFDPSRSVHFWSAAEVSAYSNEQSSSVVPRVFAMYVDLSSHWIHDVHLETRVGPDVPILFAAPLYAYLPPFHVRIYSSRLSGETSAGGSVAQALLANTPFLGGEAGNCCGEVIIAGSSLSAVNHAGGSAAAIVAGPKSAVRAAGTSYVLSGGSKRRIDQPSPTAEWDADAPFDVGSGPDAPAPAATTDPPGTPMYSFKGHDLFLETDCAPTHCSNAPIGAETHLLSFDEACTDALLGPWRDTASGNCRGI